MMSKSSFLASLKENNKRRILIWMLSALGFLLLFPAAVAVYLNNVHDNYLLEAYGQAIGSQMQKANLISRMKMLVGSNEIIVILITLLAVFSAIQGFSYLNNKKKVDFYMGMPVKRKRRFVIIWLNGILAFVIPFLIGQAVTFLIGTLYGAMDISVFRTAVISWGLNLLLYLGIYHVSLLAVMLTGNIVITFLGMVVFFLYEWIAKGVISEYMRNYFDYFPGIQYQSALGANPFLSPFRMYFDIVGADIDAWKNILLLILFIVLTGGLVYFCYLKRPAEAAGKAMVFPVTKPIVKVLIAVLAALTAGWIIGNSVNYDPNTDKSIGFVIFAMAVAILLCSCVMQIIYEFDLRALLHKKSHIVVSSILTAFIFLVFRFDLFGYDNYIPETQKLESVALVPQQLGEMSGGFFDDELNSVTAENFIRQNMYLTDCETVIELVNHSLELDKQRVIDAGDSQVLRHDGAEWFETMLCYRLRNGKVKYRNVYINVADKRSIELLDQIQSTDAFHKGFYVGTSEAVTDMLMYEEKAKIAASYGNGIYNNQLTREEAVELLELYRKDLEATGFSDIRNAVPVGRLSVQISIEKSNYSTLNRMISIDIYSFFNNCVDYLKQHDYYMDYSIQLEDVEQIEVENYNSDALYNGENESGTFAAAQTVQLTQDTKEVIPSAVIYKTYNTPEDIAQIAPSLYPVDYLYSHWLRKNDQENDYRVTVYFKSGTAVSKYYGRSANFGFVEGKIPDFVEKDTTYK